MKIRVGEEGEGEPMSPPIVDKGAMRSLTMSSEEVGEGSGSPITEEW